MLAIDNLPAIAYANQLCNLLGLDTISTGCVITFAMECFEKDIITEADTGGMSITFGNVDVMIELIRQIAAKEGFGETHSVGVKKAAEKIGRGQNAMPFI